MAQPLHPNAPPFCLALYGTDNKFNFTQVVKRMKWESKAAMQHGTEVMGFASDGDGDTRLEKAMRLLMFPETPQVPEGWEGWYHASFNNGPYYFQDHIHLAARLRTRLLKPSTLLVMGKYAVAKSHLQILLQEVSKDIHCLTLND